jgi:hypothetical protein
MTSDDKSSDPKPASNNESSQGRTDRLIAKAEAFLNKGTQFIAGTDANLRLSRAQSAATTAADARAPLDRVCLTIAKEMAEAGYQPTVEQVKAWRDILLATASAETKGDGGPGQK